MSITRPAIRMQPLLVLLIYCHSLLFSAWTTAAPPFATKEEEIDFHKAQALEAQDFFSNTLAPGATVPTYQADGNFQHKKLNSATGTWEDAASSVEFVDEFGNRITPADGNAEVDDLKSSYNNPGEINIKSAEVSSGGVSDAFDSSVESYARDPYRPNLYNDPYVQLSKQIMSDLTTNGTGTVCTSTVTTDTTALDSHIPELRTCQQAAAPPSCTIKRVPTRIVIERKSCEPGDVTELGIRGSPHDHGGGATKISTVCGGTQTSQTIQVVGMGECGGSTEYANMAITGMTNQWHALTNYRECEYESCGTFGDDHCAVDQNNTVYYRNFVCDEMPSDGTSPWRCTVEFITGRAPNTPAETGFPTNWHLATPLIRQHNIYRLDEDFIDEPPGCTSSDRCVVQPDPLYSPSTATREDQTSDETWQCTDATIRRLTNIPIDPTDNTIDGIYLPTRVAGPELLNPGGNEEIPCYTAVARNYECNIALNPSGEQPSDQSPDAVGSCAILENDPSCSLLHTTPVVTDSSGIVLLTEATFDCGFDATQISLGTSTDLTCDTDIRCIGEECFETWDENNSSFDEVAARSSTVSGASADSDCATGEPDTCKMFIGEQLQCLDASAAGASDCCNNGAAMPFTDYLQAYDLAKAVNRQFDITGKLATQLPELTSVPGYEKVVGNWNTMMSGLQTAAATAKTSIVSAINTMASPFMTGAETLIVETVVNPVSGMPLVAQQAATATPTLAAQLTADLLNNAYSLVNNLSPGLAEALFMNASEAAIADKASQELVDAGAEKLIDSNITMAFNIIMWAYLSYQIYMLVVSMVYACDDNDPIMEQRRVAKSCTALGEERDSGLGLTITKTACCFQTPLARIIQEQAVLQGARPPFGTGDTRNCSGLSITELQNLDWDRVDLKEWIAMLAASKQIPDSKELADRLFGMSNITRGTLVSDDQLTNEQRRREELRRKGSENLAAFQQNVPILEERIVTLQNEIAFLEQKLTELLSQNPLPEAMINATQDELENKRFLLQKTQNDLAYNHQKIEEVTETLETVTDVNVAFNRTTTLTRMDERLADNYHGGASTLEEHRNIERAEVWKLANVPAVFNPPPSDDTDTDCATPKTFYYHVPGDETTYSLVNQPIGTHEFTLTVTDIDGRQSSETQGSKTTTPTDTSISLSWTAPNTRSDGSPLAGNEIDHYSLTHVYTPDPSLCPPP